MEFSFDGRATRERLHQFADMMRAMDEKIGFKLSARGLCYQCESERLINKDQFDKVESWINNCRRKGILPIDFVAEEARREFSGVDSDYQGDPKHHITTYLNFAKTCYRFYSPDWWDGEEYYIQMVVEKSDLKTLFEPVCRRYHIPIANSAGWSSMLQRATYARRFKEAEEKGLRCMLLYCGDHDPDGLRISEFLRKNLADISNVTWDDGLEGYDPYDLEIKRFGLNADFIMEHNLTWIDNLITGSKKDLGSTSHKNHFMPYVQDYIRQFGKRKCEANAIVPMPDIARAFVDDVIIGYLGEGAKDRFANKKDEIALEMKDFIERISLDTSIDELIDLVEESEY